ncbi:MAG: metallophosphoesterase family protein [Planctomycetes bacterium]|nr:metallophosphoesterase family protein [Planctomycetota bacterium]
MRTGLVVFFALLLAALAASCKGSSRSAPVPPPPPPAGPAQVRRGPQIAQPAESSVIIAWLSNQPAVGSVEYVESLGNSAEVFEGAPASEHVIRLAGLKENTLYHYRLLHDGVVASEGHFFKTAPADPAAPLRCAVFGDSGSGTAAQLAVAAQVKISDPDLVLITGDVIYNVGAPHELDPAYFIPYRELIDRIPFYPSLGNHDVATAGGQPLLDALYLPRNNYTETEHYYSFDRGSVAHFIALDSNEDTTMGQPQWLWLDEDLAKAKSAGARWIFAYFHHPPYSSSSHGSSLDRRRNLGPLFDQFHVDFVFNGHDHDYERTYPLAAEEVVNADQEPDYTDPQGTVYIVTGGGGRDLYFSGLSDFTAVSESVHHHLQVDVRADKVEITAVRSDGSVLDRMSVAKTH